MSIDKQHIDDTLLTRFLADELTVAEKQQVLEWLKADAANQDYFDQIEQVWLESGTLDPVPLAVDTDAAWSKLQLRINSEEEEVVEVKRIPMARKYAVWSVAASVIVLLTFVFILRNQDTEEPILLANNAIENKLDTLPDGSMITLSQGAELSYTTAFNEDERSVKLNGKAYFDIERDTTKTFTIDAGIGGVQVLGTSFSVEVEQDSDIVVDVVSGIVRLYLPREGKDTLTLILTAGESGIISHQQQNIQKIEPEPSALYWMDRSLKFRNKHLAEVIEILEKVYQVHIETEDNIILELPLSVQFEDESVEHVINVITLTLGLEYEKSEGGYIISQTTDE